MFMLIAFYSVFRPLSFKSVLTIQCWQLLVFVWTELVSHSSVFPVAIIKLMRQTWAWEMKFILPALCTTGRILQQRYQANFSVPIWGFITETKWKQTEVYGKDQKWSYSLCGTGLLHAGNSALIFLVHQSRKTALSKEECKHLHSFKQTFQ